MLRAKSGDLDQTPRFAASDLGLQCLSTCMSNKKEARLTCLCATNGSLSSKSKLTVLILYGIYRLVVSQLLCFPRLDSAESGNI